MDAVRLEALGIDTEEGLAYCVNDPEFYEEMLGEYTADGKEAVTAMQRFLDAGDWQNYRIRAHSLKNTSRTIGARDISERAYALELAAAEKDAAAILALHGPFIDDLGVLLNALGETLGNNSHGS